MRIRIQEIEAKSIISKCGLRHSQFVINPYIGCMHGCIYCYAQFMKRFTNHHEAWGEFLDVKINAPDLIPRNTTKYKSQSILVSSVTDPYQPIERKYQLTRRILQNLIPLQPKLRILTKSALIQRDIDLLTQFAGIAAGMSLSVLNDEIRKQVEPFSSSVERRIASLKALNDAGIHTFLFVSPILFGFADWKEIVRESIDFVDEFWFENLNPYPTTWSSLRTWLRAVHPHLLKRSETAYSQKNSYWKQVERDIRIYCTQAKLDYKIFFHYKEDRACETVKPSQQHI